MTRPLRVTALILALLMLSMALCSCEVVQKVRERILPPTEAPRGIPETVNKDYINLNQSEYNESNYYSPVHPRHSYEQLSKGQQALYDQLYDSVREVYPDTDAEEELYKTKQVIVDDYLLSTADIRVAAKALYDDNPDLFWLSSTIYQLTDSNGGYTAVQMRSIYAPEEIKRMQAEITKAVDAFHATVPSGLSEYGREKYVHDYIIDNCVYDSQAAETHTSADRIEEAYTVYGALVLKKAVCEGYARAMQLLLTGLGVDCVGVTGLGFDTDGTQELHMWDAVCLDGSWYFVDPTWDDQDYDYRRYQYFNLDAATMNKDHQPSRLLSELSEDDINGDETFSSVAMNIFVPACTATYYQYYLFECPHLENYDGEDVINSIYRAALEQAEFINIYIDPDALDYDEATRVLFRESPQYFFDYLVTVNDWLTDYEIDTGNIRYVNNEQRSVVTVMLEYY